jgi:hypothetical protein
MTNVSARILAFSWAVMSARRSPPRIRNTASFNWG